MIKVITTAANDLIIFLFALYTFYSFYVFRKKTEEERRHIYHAQVFILYAISFLANMILYLHTDSFEVLFYFVAQVLFFAAVLMTFPLVYKHVSRLLLNHMCMLLSIGFFMLARLDMNKSVKQFLIAAAVMVLGIFVPLIIEKAHFLDKLTVLYGVLGVGMLAAVFIYGSITYGSKINITIHGITFAPGEFVKILFVFFLAGMLYQDTSFRRVVWTTLLAAVHVLILVASKDLGGALILFIVYLTVLYIATKRLAYLAAGLLCFSGAAVAAFFLFSHVRVRVLTWTTSFEVLKNDTSQVAQSLFGISTGGWFGSGLYEGLPDTIPVSVSDFIFSAIVEELGLVFGICLILVTFSCFLLFINISLQIKEQFYKLVSFGLSVAFIFQVFLTIGGDIKFIPLTGVTLPLVSYGGSSVISSIVVFSIIQGMYIIKQDEVAIVEKNKRLADRRKENRKET